MFGKVFASMYEGSLYGQWQAIITMQQLIVLADSEGYVDMTPPAIAARTSIPLEYIEAGLKILSEPDPYSRTPDNDGRRIEPIDPDRPWGWRLVNHAYYRDLASKADKREKDRVRIAEKRAKSKVSQPVADSREPSRKSPIQKQKQKHKQDTKEEKKPARSARAIPVDDFLQACETSGELPIPADDPIFDYAEKTGIPVPFVELAWREFLGRYRDSGKTQKGINGWRNTFRNCVKGNWYHLWYAADGGYSLTTAGVQAKKAHA